MTCNDCRFKTEVKGRCPWDFTYEEPSIANYAEDCMDFHYVDDPYDKEKYPVLYYSDDGT